MHIDADVLQPFIAWLMEETHGDPSFGVTALSLISAAKGVSQRCLDDLLNLPNGNFTLREWVGINLVQLDRGNPFPTGRRVGGGEGRGFSPALNAEMRKLHGSDPVGWT